MQVTISFIDIAVIVVSTGLIIWWALKKVKAEIPSHTFWRDAVCPG